MPGEKASPLNVPICVSSGHPPGTTLPFLLYRNSAVVQCGTAEGVRGHAGRQGEAWRSARAPSGSWNPLVSVNWFMTNEATSAPGWTPASVTNGGVQFVGARTASEKLPGSKQPKSADGHGRPAGESGDRHREEQQRTVAPTPPRAATHIALEHPLQATQPLFGTDINPSLPLLKAGAGYHSGWDPGRRSIGTQHFALVKVAVGARKTYEESTRPPRGTAVPACLTHVPGWRRAFWACRPPG